MRDAAHRILVLTAAVWRIDAPLQKCAGAFLLEMRMKSLFILMAQFDSKLRLSLDEACEAIGYAKQTAYNELSLGQFPIPMQKCANKWVADIRDVAEYLDHERDAARQRHAELSRIAV